jgi:hypothetical protein
MAAGGLCEGKEKGEEGEGAVKGGREVGDKWVNER